MKVNDFKLLATLPEEYDYEIFKQPEGLLVIGRCFSTIIAFTISNDKIYTLEIKEKDKD